VLLGWILAWARFYAYLHDVTSPKGLQVNLEQNSLVSELSSYRAVLNGPDPSAKRRISSEIFGFVDYTHPTTAQLPHDAVVRDSLADHAQGCYGGSADKSMTGGGLEGFQEGYWRTSPLHSQPSGQPLPGGVGVNVVTTVIQNSF
jgi:hypothetical protein